MKEEKILIFDMKSTVTETVRHRIGQGTKLKTELNLKERKYKFLSKSSTLNCTNGAVGVFEIILSAFIRFFNT